MTNGTASRQDRTVLWVPAVGEVAGAGRHVLDVVGEGIPGWRVIVLCPPGPLRDALPQAQVIAVGGYGQQAGFRSSVRAVRQVVHAIQPDIVHSHLSWADLACVAAMTGRPLVSTEHGICGDRMEYATSRIDATVTAMAHTARLRRTRALICVSRATADAVGTRWHPPHRMIARVVPNGIERRDHGDDTRRSTAPLTVGYLGRFAPEKRVDLLVRALPALLHNQPGARLFLAGSGETEAGLRDLIDKLGLTEHVRFEGWVDSQAWLPDIDVLCVPSIWENCSYAILEALSMGVGVVAAPVGGNVELLPTHALAEPLDELGLATAIERQLIDVNQRPSLPDSIPTVAGMAEQIAEVYAEVITRAAVNS